MDDLDSLWRRVEEERLLWLSAPVAEKQTFRHALQQFHAALSSTEQTATNVAITSREREVLTLICSGKSSKQIATELGIAFRTVICHRYRIQTKLRAHNTAELMRAAMRMGLIEM